MYSYEKIVVLQSSQPCPAWTNLLSSHQSEMPVIRHGCLWVEFTMTRVSRVSVGVTGVMEYSGVDHPAWDKQADYQTW